MSRITIYVLGLGLLLSATAFAQTDTQTSNPPPRSEDRSGTSSSKDSRVDLSPPPGDAGAHPGSEVPGDVNEMRRYDPHKAEKNIEVGDYHFKRKNYRAAESRYREALEWKPGDAQATYNLAVCEEKLGELVDARAGYETYLKILPHGPHADESRAAVQRLASATEAKSTAEAKKSK